MHFRASFLLLLVGIGLCQAVPNILGVSAPQADGFDMALSSTSNSVKTVQVSYAPNMNPIQGSFTTAAMQSGTYQVRGLQAGNYYIQITDTDGISAISGPHSTTCTQGGEIKLQTNASDVSTVPTLTLVFREHEQFSSIEYEFINGPQCKSNGGSHGTWIRSAADPTQCDAVTMTHSVSFTDSLTHCGWTRNEDDPNLTVYEATVKVTTVEPGSVIRGVQYEKTVESTVTVQVAFWTNVSATSSPINVFGPRITYAQVIEQIFDPSTTVATVKVVTSVQWPYQLNTPTMTAPAGWDITWNPETPDATAEGSNASACLPVGANNQYDEDEPCSQHWIVTIKRQQTCGTEITSLDLDYNGWQIGYGVGCHNDFSGACDTPNPGADQVSFDTSSDNYCPRLVDTEEATADLRVYELSDYTKEQDQFVFGTKSYFECVVTSSIPIEQLHTEGIQITQNGAAGTNNMYSNAFTNAASFFANGGDSVAADGQYGTDKDGSGFDDASGAAMAVIDNVPSSANVKKTRFYWTWSDKTSAASGDFSSPTTIKTDVRIRYANLTQSSADEPSRPTLLRAMLRPSRSSQSGMRLRHAAGMQLAAQEPGSSAPGTAAALVGVKSAGSTSSDDAAAPAPNGGGAGMGGGMMALVAACALVALAALAMVARRKKKQAEEENKVENKAEMKAVPAVDAGEIELSVEI